MDAAQLETVLVRLSLDGAGSVRVGSISAHPLIAVAGKTLYGAPKTVLVRKGGYSGRFTSAPGVTYVVADAEGRPCAEFCGREVRTDVNETTLETFVERFGPLFSRSEVDLSPPSDPFASLLAALG